MSSPTVYRRLQGLFSSTKSTTPTLKPRNKPDPAAAGTPTISRLKTTKKRTKSLPPAANLKTIVNNFKKSCNSDHFRYRYKHYEQFVTRLARAKQFSHIEDVLEHQKKYEKDITREPFVVRLISLYGKCHMFTHAQKLFDEMPQLKCDRTVVSFNALLAACVNSKKFDKVSELFRELPQKLSIEPDAVSYNTIIKAFCEMGSMDSAVDVIHEMEKIGCVPNLITFNTIIDAFYQKGEFINAEKVWGLMESKNLVPDVRSYNSKVRGLCENNRIAEGISLIEEMKKRGVQPDVYTYNGLIHGFLKDGSLMELKMWYTEIAKNGLVPDRVTFLMAIPFACEKGDFGFAFELCKEALNHKQIVSREDVQLVVNGLAKELDFDEAKELVELVNSNNRLPYKLKLPADK